jgi:indole-3-glycerol phosphate synthase
VTTILDRIVETKRKEVASAKARVPPREMAARAARAEGPRDFHAAIRATPPHGIHLIAEIKKASPSAGLIRADFDPAAIARAYHQAGATALSVLTDETYFQGHLDHIERVKVVVPLPVLRKDFTVDAYQVYESRAAGADAILLIAEVLPADDIVHLLSLAESLGMTTLVESHGPERLVELRSAIEAAKPARCLLGINNRDLTRQAVDLATTTRAAERLGDTSTLVAESGIHTRDDVQAVRRAGAAAMLVGEALMSAEDIGAKVRELLA